MTHIFSVSGEACHPGPVPPRRRRLPSAVKPQPKIAAKDAKSHGKNAKNNNLASSLCPLAVLAAIFLRAGARIH